MPDFEVGRTKRSAVPAGCLAIAGTALRLVRPTSKSRIDGAADSSSFGEGEVEASALIS